LTSIYIAVDLALGVAWSSVKIVSATKLLKRKRRPAPLATQHAYHQKSLTATRRCNIPSKSSCKVLNSQNQETCLCI